MVFTFSRSILKHAAWVSGSTALAQAVTLLATPLLTRLYAPEVFGAVGVFFSLLALLLPLATFSFALAIVPAETADEASGLTRLCWRLSLLLAAFAFLLILPGLQSHWIGFLSLEIIQSYLFLLPPAILLASANLVLSQWMARKKSFAMQGKILLLHALLLNAGKGLAGLRQPTAAVMIGVTLACSLLQAICLGFALRHQGHRTAAASPSHSLLDLARKYRAFPLYKTPQIFLHTLGDALPLLFLTAAVGPFAAGSYAVAHKMLSLPVSLLADALRQVLYPELAEAQRQQLPLFPLLRKTLVLLCLVGGPPFLVLFFFSPVLFRVLLGPDWVQAGQVAARLTPLMFMVFLGRPVMSAVLVLGRQKSLLLFEILLTLVKSAALGIGLFFLRDDLFAVTLFSVSSAIGMFIFLVLMLYAAHKADQLRHVS